YIAAGSINYAGLASNPLIILSSTENISSGLAKELKSYVQNGGSLMVFPSPEGHLTGLITLTEVLGTAIPQQVLTQELKVTGINLEHPVFKGVFSHSPGKIDLPVARKFVQYRNVIRSSRQRILKFPGDNDLLSQYSIGKGK